MKNKNIQVKQNSQQSQNAAAEKTLGARKVMNFSLFFWRKNNELSLKLKFKTINKVRIP